LVMVLLWLLVWALILALQPLVLGLSVVFPPAIFAFWGMTVLIYLGIGFNTARSLLKYLEKEKLV
ncbi:MAG: hypothetical protein LWX83_17820, partial [Anaerolineae bacterium]|nr:hypothetical protein [Anaerolineae bacterium]